MQLSLKCQYQVAIGKRMDLNPTRTTITSKQSILGSFQKLVGRVSGKEFHSLSSFPVSVETSFIIFIIISDINAKPCLRVFSPVI